MNAAARLVSGTRNCDRGLSHGWTCRSKWNTSWCRWCIAACLHGKAPRSCLEHCRSTASAFRRSSSTGCAVSTCGRRSGLLCWGSDCLELPERRLRDMTLSADSFRRLLKTRLFSVHQYTQRIWGATRYALYKSTTYLLTYKRTLGETISQAWLQLPSVNLSSSYDFKKSSVCREI